MLLQTGTPYVMKVIRPLNQTKFKCLVYSFFTMGDLITVMNLVYAMKRQDI